jgi:hypothetical protein
MVNKKKRYIGAIADEEQAAYFYDCAAVQNNGIQVKSSFIFRQRQISLTRRKRY